MRHHTRGSIALLVLIAVQEPAVSAETRAPGQTVAYQLIQSSITQVDFSKLPAYVRSQAERNFAAANGKATTTELTLNITSVDPDGNARVNARAVQSMEGLSGPSASAFSTPKEFPGTLSADGRFTPTYDPAMPATLDSHGRYSAAAIANIHAQTLLNTFTDFNTFVSGIIRHPNPKSGDVWRLVVQDESGVSRQYDFSVGSSDSTGASGQPEILMKGSFVSSTSSSQITAAGRYDPQRQLVTEFHEENKFSATTPTGMSSAGVSTLRFQLRN